MDVQLKKRITHLLAMEHLLKQTILHTEALLQDLKKPLITKNFHEFIKIGEKELIGLMRNTIKLLKQDLESW